MRSLNCFLGYSGGCTCLCEMKLEFVADFLDLWCMFGCANELVLLDVLTVFAAVLSIRGNFVLT
jgi:hypothetical protein